VVKYQRVTTIKKEGTSMADTVSKKSNEPFMNQAKMHRDFADHTRQMISQYQVYHNNLIEATQGSCVSNSVQNYIDWWESFHPHLLNKADLHEQMADHLERTTSNFDETDTNIGQTFS
jgi:uncharacterized protein YukE